MRTTIQALLTTLVMLVLPATASANFAHTVMPGESLYSVAETDGLSVAALAAANGVSTNSQLVTGSTLEIPPQGAATQAAPADSAAAPTSSAASSSSRWLRRSARRHAVGDRRGERRHRRSARGGERS